MSGLWIVAVVSKKLLKYESRARWNVTATAQNTFNIPRRTLRNHLKSDSDQKRFGRKSVLSLEQEGDLVKRIIRFSDVGMPVTSSLLRRNVYQFCEKNNLSTSFNSKKCMAGRDWYKAFLKRNRSVMLRKAQNMNPSRARKLNRFIVTDDFTMLKKIMTDMELFNKPEEFLNMDEKG